MECDAGAIKAFNIVGNYHMFRLDFPGGQPPMFMCRNEEYAKKTARGILDHLAENLLIYEAIEDRVCQSRLQG
jgi:hypothetical protein